MIRCSTVHGGTTTANHAEAPEGMGGTEEKLRGKSVYCLDAGSLRAKLSTYPTEVEHN